MNNLFGVFVRVWKTKEKGFWEKLLFELHYLGFIYFPKIFFELLVSNPLVFSTLEPKSTILFYRSFCVGKRDCFVVVVLATKFKRKEIFVRESLWSFDYSEITCIGACDTGYSCGVGTPVIV